MTGDLLTLAEAADRLRTSTWFLRRELSAGRLRGALYAGAWKTTPAALDEYLAAHANRVRPRRRRPPP